MKAAPTVGGFLLTPDGFCLHAMPACDKTGAMSEETNTPDASGKVDNAQTTATTVSPAELVGSLTPAQPEVAAPVTPAAATVVVPAELVDGSEVLPPGKGKGNRTLDDYARLDWSKSNAELAKIAGVSRQRILQIRQELKAREENEALAGSESEIGGLPPGQQTPTAQPLSQAQQATPTPSPVNYQLMAETVFSMSTGLATMLIGPEWQPRQLKNPATGETIEEKAAVVEALRVYFESKQFQDLPPGYMLCFVIASYAAPRFSHDNTRSKFKLTWLWIKTKVGGFFNRRKKFVPAIVPNPATQTAQGN